MRATAFVLLLAASNASAFWGWHDPYYYHRYHAVPAYYTVPTYYTPLYFYPSYNYAIWCECPPEMTYMPAPQSVPQTLQSPAAPPARMPEKPPAKAAAPEAAPYAPIAPASAASEEKIPKADLPLAPNPEAPAKKEEFVPSPLPKIELAPAAPPKIELPSATPAAPKIELPPLPAPTTSRFRPLSVTTTPVPGATSDGRFSLVFQNHAERDVELMVDGSRITLPAKHTTTATVSRNYRVSIDGGEVEFKVISAQHRGAEIVLK